MRIKYISQIFATTSSSLSVFLITCITVWRILVLNIHTQQSCWTALQRNQIIYNGLESLLKDASGPHQAVLQRPVNHTVQIKPSPCSLISLFPLYSRQQRHHAFNHPNKAATVKDSHLFTELTHHLQADSCWWAY